MSTISRASATVQSVVVSLLIDRRAQAVAALALALACGLLLGSDSTEAMGAIGNGPRPRG